MAISSDLQYCFGTTQLSQIFLTILVSKAKQRLPGMHAARIRSAVMPNSSAARPSFCLHTAAKTSASVGQGGSGTGTAAAALADQSSRTSGTGGSPTPRNTRARCCPNALARDASVVHSTPSSSKTFGAARAVAPQRRSSLKKEPEQPKRAMRASLSASKAAAFLRARLCWFLRRLRSSLSCRRSAGVGLRRCCLILMRSSRLSRASFAPASDRCCCQACCLAARAAGGRHCCAVSARTVAMSVY